MESHETGDLEDDEISSHRGAHHKDIGVEVLPDNPSQASKRSSATNRLWSHGSSSSSPSDDASDKDYDSDATFRLPSNQKAFGRVQQPDSVHLPEHDTASSEHHLLDIEDLTESLSNRKRRHRDAESVSQRTRKKKRPEGMDVEMDMGESSRRDSDSDDGIEEITRAPGRRRSRNTHWHEPEKDREYPSMTLLTAGIVITSLSSSPSSSRSSSPENTSQHRNLTQPGEQGFTLSPSLLTHLLGKQSWDKMPPLSGHSPDQKGLVLYRPLGIPPGTDMQWDEIVRRWKEGGSGSGTQQDDSSRFEMIDDDENLQSFQAKSMADQGMDESGPVVNEYGVGDVPMDIE